MNYGLAVPSSKLPNTVKLGALAKAIIIIQDDGDSGAISFVADTLAVSEATNQLVTVTVTRTGRFYPNSTVSVEVKSVDNEDIKEVQSVYCAATSGYFNLTFQSINTTIPALGMSATDLEAQLKDDLNVDFTVKYSSTTTIFSVSQSVASSSTSTAITYIAPYRSLVIGETVAIYGHADSMTTISVSQSIASSSTVTTITHSAGARPLVVGDTVTHIRSLGCNDWFVYFTKYCN